MSSFYYILAASMPLFVIASIPLIIILIVYLIKRKGR